MWHPTEDDLILRFYGEHEAAETSRIDGHLRTCGACQSAWTELTETLKLVDTAPVPEPPPGFERVMWAKVQQALPEREPSFWTWRRLVPIASVAALVIAVVAITSRTRESAPAPSTASSTSAASTKVEGRGQVAKAGDNGQLRERVLLTALDGHFEQTELLLVELLNAPEDGTVDLEFERMTAGDLVASGRLYRMSATQIGKGRLAAVLEELEPVLVEVARSDDQAKRKDLRFLRSQINEEGLLFKVRAVTTQIRERQQEIITTTHEGGL
jgi:hypothetical protein